MGVWLLLFAIVPSAGRADATKETCVAQLSDDEVFEQLLYVQRSFAQQRGGAASWWIGWTGFNVFNIVYGSYKTATAQTRLAYDSWLVSSIGAGLFVANVTALPMPGMYAYRRFRTWPDHTPGERRQKLVLALNLLERAARIERLNAGFWAQLTAFAYATISTGYVWLRNPQAPSDKLILALTLQFFTSIAVAEATFFTVPRRARRDLERVRDAVCTSRNQAKEMRRVTWSAGVGAGQLGILARF